MKRLLPLCLCALATALCAQSPQSDDIKKQIRDIKLSENYVYAEANSEISFDEARQLATDKLYANAVSMMADHQMDKQTIQKTWESTTGDHTALEYRTGPFYKAFVCIPKNSLVKEEEAAPATETAGSSVETPATEAPVPEPVAAVPEAIAANTPEAEAPATETPAPEPVAAVPEAIAANTPEAVTPATEVPATEMPAPEPVAEEVPASEAPATETPSIEAPVAETPAEATGNTPEAPLPPAADSTAVAATPALPDVVDEPMPPTAITPLEALPPLTDDPNFPTQTEFDTDEQTAALFAKLLGLASTAPQPAGTTEYTPVVTDEPEAAADTESPAGAAPAAVADPRTELPEEYRKVLDDLLSLDTYESVMLYLSAMKEDGRMMYGPLKKIFMPERAYLLIVKDGKMVTILDKGKGDRINLKTLEQEPVQKYIGYGIIWFQIYNKPKQ